MVDRQKRLRDVAWQQADAIQCDGCGGWFDNDEIDGKPDALARPVAAFLWRLLPEWLAVRILCHLADTGHDFNTLECRHCYGPGFEAGCR